MTLHRFKPDLYYTTIGSHPPVLHVASGDTIVTTTVDAGGKDAGNRQITPRGNPMTGPFFVEGAEPGDTLAVDLVRLVPARREGWSAVALAPNVVDPDDVAALPRPAPGAALRGDWDVDVAAGVATLLAPETTLGRLALPLAPMLGCFGVAPAGGQAISTATSGPHGGNMDYRGFTAGVTVYFPVFAPGALLFVGDGHALQGDGEIGGTGVEIAFDVELAVRLLKGRRSQWPRGENAEFIFTVGNARPLDQCVQHATSEMLRWLQQDYGLDVVAANLLLSHAVRYDLGNMFDPAYTMVCKIPKSVLPRR